MQGLPALTVPGVGTLTDALRLRLDSIERLGDDVLPDPDALTLTR